jgi:transposase
MSQRQTTVAERHQIVDLKLAGYSLPEIAEQTGWSFECVRSWWRRYRDGGRKALDPVDGRKQRGGRMSSFPTEIQAAYAEIKEQHPGWGAPVAQARVAEQLDLDQAQQPSISTIEKLWAEKHPELLRSHRPQRPPPASKPVPDISEPHERWQLDFKEWMAVETVGYVDVLNIRDEATPVKIGSFVYPARKSTGRDIQAALRQAFSQWGLCDRLQTDRDKRLFNAQLNYPFPTPVILWLVGLGISHDIAPSAPASGCVECFNGTWYDRVLLGRQFETLEQIQQASDEELFWMNHKLPSQGRACHGRPPLEAYPEAKSPRRPYSPDRELELFSMQRVYDYLAHQFWWRRVTKNGQISLGGHRYGISTDYAGDDIRLDFEADAAHFVARTGKGAVIKRLPPKQLTVAHITGLDRNPD